MLFTRWIMGLYFIWSARIRAEAPNDIEELALRAQTARSATNPFAATRDCARSRHRDCARASCRRLAHRVDVALRWEDEHEDLESVHSIRFAPTFFLSCTHFARTYWYFLHLKQLNNICIYIPHICTCIALQLINEPACMQRWLPAWRWKVFVATSSPTNTSTPRWVCNRWRSNSNCPSPPFMLLSLAWSSKTNSMYAFCIFLCKHSLILIPS